MQNIKGVKNLQDKLSGEIRRTSLDKIRDDVDYRLTRDLSDLMYLYDLMPMDDIMMEAYKVYYGKD